MGDFAFTAPWIGLPAELSDDRPDVWFRTVGEFELAEAPEQATLYIAADSYWQLFVNGCEIRRLQTRGSMNLNCFDAIEVAKYLRPGRNVVAALVFSQMEDNFSRSPDHPALRLEIPGIVATGAGWRIRRAADFNRAVMPFNFQLGYVEDRDLRLEVGSMAE